MSVLDFFRQAGEWFTQTSDRTLDRAYRAALEIKAIETNYFRGRKVSAEDSPYSAAVVEQLEVEIRQYLQAVKRNLSAYEFSRASAGDGSATSDRALPRQRYDRETLVKLELIEEIVAKYEGRESLALVPTTKGKDPARALDKARRPSGGDYASKRREDDDDGMAGSTSVLPRSLLRTLARIRREIGDASEAEEEVVKTFRRSRNKTNLAVRFLLVLLVIPLLAHNVTKIALEPIVERTLDKAETEQLFINEDVKEEALEELQVFAEGLRFRSMLDIGARLSPSEIEAEVKEKAAELAEEYRRRGIDARCNIFADLASVAAFGIVLVLGRRELEMLKSFIDEVVYGLSDSAKAFLIILFTDTFVGYHSPHGWEIVLEGASRHFGLPENREFNFLFIATFPVILDTVLKYWIFRYLNRISPSAVATYRNMNE